MKILREVGGLYFAYGVLIVYACNTQVFCLRSNKQRWSNTKSIVILANRRGTTYVLG